MDLIRRVYETEPCPRTFERDLWLHLCGGCVFSTPDLFVMGRGVARSAPVAEIVDPSVIFDRERQDCWWVYAAAGDLARMPQLLPYPLPWIGWERKNVPRIWPIERVLELCEANRVSVIFNS